MADVIPMPLVPEDSFEAVTMRQMKEWLIQARAEGRVPPAPPADPPLRFRPRSGQLRLPFETLVFEIKARR